MNTSDHKAHNGPPRDKAPTSRILALLLLPAAVLVAFGLLSLRLYFQPPTVPAYVIAGRGAPKRLGEAGDTEIGLRPGGQFSIEVRPVRAVDGAVGARGFLLRDDVVRPWDPPFVVAQDGSVRIEGPVDTLFAGVPTGAWELAVAVGRPENLPTAPRDVLRVRDMGADAGVAAWRLLRERVRLLSDP